MNGIELGRGLYFGCAVFAAGGGLVAYAGKEGETCNVKLADGTPAILCSEGPKQGFYIQFPVQGLTIERIYPYAPIGNPFLELAHGDRARAT